MSDLKKGENHARPGFDAAMAGKRAECDGGHAIAGTHFAGRQEVAGTLTGDYVDYVDPASRWYRLTDLTRKPERYPEDSVWCEAGNVFVIGDDAS